ncbi:MAG TPA: hypothetical protein VKQ70_10955, partial [Caulobacteraceae bacterium]|nr:hypothetical protein [Caulobacteraceae bacterium]
MPDTPKSGAAGGADFVKNIVKDPANVPDVKQYVGWVGESSVPNAIRLYLTADLSSYLEIPSADVLHRAPVAGSTDGAEQLWVRQESAIQAKAAPAANNLAHFFAGALAGAAQAGAPQGPQAQALTLPAQCQSVQAACHPTLGCPPPPTALCTHPPGCVAPTPVCTHPPQCAVLTPVCTAVCTVPPQCPLPTAPPVCVHPTPAC